MSKSPGHQKYPDHQVNEQHLAQRMSVSIDGQRVAESSDVILVKEDGSPPRYYFPRDDVRMERFAQSSTTTTCPFKGSASYFSFKEGEKPLTDFAWSYEEPFDEHADLAGRIAFYEEKFPQLRRTTE